MIEVKNLTKRYGSHTAVSNLSFHIETGQIYGFLGPNGAGKSTTMNFMTGCLAATEGEVTVGGYDIFEDAAQAKRRIGYLPERPPLYLDRTPLEYLAFVGQAKGLTGSALEEQMRRVMAVTQIESVSNRLIKNLSKGYKQRVGIAQALLGDPEVVILDEPTVGAGPQADHGNPGPYPVPGQRPHSDPQQSYFVRGPGGVPHHPHHLRGQAGGL